MKLGSSAIPRQALVSLLVRAERAAAEGDESTAEALLNDLHWFAHADGQLHSAVHRLELSMARKRGDVRGAIGQVLPNLFARSTSLLESYGPAFEVVRTIDAAPEAVYRVLSDVAAYGEWNPWIAKGVGSATRLGDEVVVDARLGDKTMPVRHRMLVASPPQRFGWYDLGWFTAFAAGRRLRWIEPSGAGTRFVSQIRLHGPFAHLAWRLHGRSIRDGMTAEAEALGARSVALARAGEVAGGSGAAEKKPLAGQTCVVTGPTHGIGRPTALALGELGARVLLLCRDRPKGDELAAELAERGAEAEVIDVDLASLRDVERAAGEVLARAPRIDVLVNNAGVLNAERRTTVDGFEECFGVNFLAHFLLTDRLLPALRAAPAGRIVHVTSNTHAIAGAFDFSDYDWTRRRYGAYPAYAQSKLAILLFNRSLARRLAGTTVTSNALHPGIVGTGLGTDNLGAFVTRVVKPVFLTPEEGAMTTIHLAASPSVARCQGEYFVDSRVARPSRHAQDDVAAERLFHLAEELLAARGFADRRAA